MDNLRSLGLALKNASQRRQKVFLIVALSSIAAFAIAVRKSRKTKAHQQQAKEISIVGHLNHPPLF
jgi:hypothetical protein